MEAQTGPCEAHTLGWRRKLKFREENLKRGSRTKRQALVFTLFQGLLGDRLYHHCQPMLPLTELKSFTYLLVTMSLEIFPMFHNRQLQDWPLVWVTSG